MRINIGTRGSKLALAQTDYVISQLKNNFPNYEYNKVIIKTTGDIDLSHPLDQIGSKGVFVDEIEQALIEKRIDLAVHSMKDMPADVLPGLCFAKSWKREDPRDAIILKDASSLFELKKGAIIGTGSKRRAFQLLQIRPDLNIVNIRGNIDTRIKKLKEGLDGDRKLDGIILAAAGLKRLGLQDYITAYFEVEDMIPSPAQGTLAIELREDNTILKDMVNSLSDEVSEDITFLERGFLSAIGGDCHLPIGAVATHSVNGYELLALFGSEDGRHIAKTRVFGKNASCDMIDRAVYDIRKQLKEL